jgi:adenosine deaminase
LIPATAHRLGLRNRVPLPEATFTSAGDYAWSDFSSFLAAYDKVTSVVRNAHDLEEIALDYLRKCAAEGTVYVEFMLSPPDLERYGVPYEEQLAALDAARTQGSEELGIESRLIVTAVRQLGPRAAVSAARLAISCRSELVAGFGLTGDERQFEVKDFEDAFHIAGSEGLGLTAHAGEHLGPETILEAIERLGLHRVGHGIRAIEAPEVVRQLASEAIPLEICLSSNLALGLYPDITSHPLRALVEAGCRVALGTDDPGFFGNSPAQEYASAEVALGNGVNRITKHALESAFCDAATIKQILGRMESQ